MRPTLGAILERDHWVCGLCREPIVDIRDATRDHLIPLYRQGPREADWNLVPAHQWCNAAKGHRAPRPEDIRWDLMRPEEVSEARRVIARAAWEWRSIPPNVTAFLYGLTDIPPQVATA